MPWVRVEKTYQFTAPDGAMNLRDLFGDPSQLIVQHFMMGEDWQEGCPSCSFWADGFDGTLAHFAARDTAFVAVSNAPLDRIESYKSRMGWDFPWVSAFGSDFSTDFHVTFPAGTGEYNYREKSGGPDELPGISVFARDGDAVFHSYSTYSRGLDNMNVVYQYLDLTPKGRDEDTLPWPMAWVRRHDAYGDAQ